MVFDDLTPEQKEQLKNCNTTEELVALAEESGYELTDEELDEISGGGWGCTNKEPRGGA